MSTSTRSSVPSRSPSTATSTWKSCSPRAGSWWRRALRRREHGPWCTIRTKRCAPTSCPARTRITSCANGEVVIIDEFTGRMMPGRRYSDGLHQALEAKERVQIQPEKPDARLDHFPELFPPLRQARRNDRNGGDRGRRVPGDLQARGRGDPDQYGGGRARTTTTRSTGRRRSAPAP